jgi:peptide/nickel transport system substrate-binding protein
LQERVATGDYHLVAFDSAGYDPYVMNSFYLSDGLNNFTNYANPELDAALLDAMRETSPNTRRAYYVRIQEFIMEEALILPIRDYVNLNASVPTIEGLTYDSYGWFPLMYNVSYTSGG